LGEPLCPTLLFFGGQDPYIPPAEIERVGAHYPDTIVYPEAGHGFMRDGSDSYDEKSANDAWARTLAFFRTHLR
jgi:carboxymethylenebutenolidase